MLVYPETANPINPPIPANRAPRSHSNTKYEEIMTLVRQAAGEYVVISDPSLVAGATDRAKQIALIAAAKTRNMRIHVTSQHGFIYLKLKKEVA